MRREIRRLRALFIDAPIVFMLALLIGCSGAPFTTIGNLVAYDPGAGDASGSDPVRADAAVLAPGSDAGAVDPETGLPQTVPDAAAPNDAAPQIADAKGDEGSPQTVPDADPPPTVDAGDIDAGSPPALCAPTSTTCPACGAGRDPCCKDNNVCGCEFGTGAVCF